MKLIVYSKPGCPHCVKLQEILSYLEFEITVYNLYEDFTKEEFYNKFGEGSTFPQVLNEHDTLGGAVDTINYLKERDLCCQ